MKKTEEEIKQAAKEYIKPFKHQLHLGQDESVINDFIAGAKWMQEQDEWISVEDRLPEDRVNVLILVPTPDRSEEFDIRIDRIVEGYFFRSIPESVTHWQPLPEPPKH